MNIKTNSKFFGLINNKYKMLEEQPVQPPMVPQAPVPGPEVATQETETIKVQEPEVATLTSAGELELIRLLKKALQMNLQPGDIPSSIIDADINEKNGREVLAKIKSFMKSFVTPPTL